MNRDERGAIGCGCGSVGCLVLPAIAAVAVLVVARALRGWR